MIAGQSLMRLGLAVIIALLLASPAAADPMAIGGTLARVKVAGSTVSKWSANGRYYVDGGYMERRVLRFAETGRALATIPDNAFDFHIAVGDDGTVLLETASAGIVDGVSVIRSGDTTPSPVPVPPGARLSADGRTLTYLRGSTVPNPASEFPTFVTELHQFRLQSGEDRTLATTRKEANPPPGALFMSSIESVSRDGSAVTMRYCSSVDHSDTEYETTAASCDDSFHPGPRHWAQHVLGTVQVSAPLDPVWVTFPGRPLVDPGLWPLVWAANGDAALAYVNTNLDQVWLHTRADSRTRLLPLLRGTTCAHVQYTYWRLSANGRFLVCDLRQSPNQIYLADLATGSVTPIVSGLGSARYPGAFNPEWVADDGSAVVFDTDRGDGPNGSYTYGNVFVWQRAAVDDAEASPPLTVGEPDPTAPLIVTVSDDSSIDLGGGTGTGTAGAAPAWVTPNGVCEPGSNTSTWNILRVTARCMVTFGEFFDRDLQAKTRCIATVATDVIPAVKLIAIARKGRAIGHAVKDLRVSLEALKFSKTDIGRIKTLETVATAWTISSDLRQMRIGTVAMTIVAEQAWVDGIYKKLYNGRGRYATAYKRLRAVQSGFASVFKLLTGYEDYKNCRRAFGR